MARRMLALLTALLLVASLPLAVLADEWSLDNGDVTVSVNAEGTQHVSQGENKKEDAAPTIKGGNGSQSITVSTTGENKANLTIQDVNAKTIDVGESNATITVSGENNKVSNDDGAGIHVSSGDLTITGDGTLEANGNYSSAAIGSNNGEDMSGSITFEDNATVTGTGIFGAGIGSGYSGEMSGSITIEDNAQVNGTSVGGAGIGSGDNGKMSGTITIEDNAQVNGTSTSGAGIGSGSNIGDGSIDGRGEMSGIITIGGAANVTAKGGSSSTAGSNAGIGSGRDGTMSGTIAISTKATVDASSIGAGRGGEMSGTIQYFDPDAVPTQPEPGKTPLYRVLNERGEPLSCTKELADGVLTITVDADYAKLIGTVLSLKTLEKQGVTSITLVTKNATSTFSLADLQAKGTGTYTLTHDKETVTFTLAKTDVSDILK